MSLYKPESRIPVLEVLNCTKVFQGETVNLDISFALSSGEILSVLGENGAGKSTLLKIIYGLHKATEGEIVVRGHRLQAHSPRDAIAEGIGIVPQYSQLIPTMTVAENIVLGQEKVKGPRLNVSVAAKEILKLARQCNWEIAPNRLTAELSYADQIRVEVVRALYRNAELLILDEPTSFLTPQESDSLFEVLRKLAAQGMGIIFLTPKLREAMAIANRILVLRRGRAVGFALPDQTSESELTSLMLGRGIAPSINKEMFTSARFPVLEIEHVDVLGAKGRFAVNDLTLSVNAGEVVGILGTPDNGQTELLQAITGMRRPQTGNLLLSGRDITRASPRQIAQRGNCGYVPEDRREFGLVEAFSVTENYLLKMNNQPPFSWFGMLRPRQNKRQALRLSQELNLQVGGSDQAGGRLSSGDQQRLVMARESSHSPKLLVVAEPTRGVDVESAEFIHAQITQMRNQGTAVLLVSYDLDEIINLADRIAVMFEGRLIDLLPSSQADRNRLGLLMAGHPS